MKNIFLFLSCLILSTLLNGCASIMSGTQQTVSVHTGHVTGALCSLENSKGKWYVNQTPGSVTIPRSYKDLLITCEKKGYHTQSLKVKSTMRKLVLANLVFFPFYLIVGPLVGLGVDVIDGAAYEYPADLMVPMS